MKNIMFAGQGQRPTGFAGPRGTPDTMDIVLRVLGQIIVNDMADIFHMNAP